MTNLETDEVIKKTRLWVENFVIALNLCPFARKPMLENTITFDVADASSQEELYQQILAALDAFFRADETEVVTHLLICPTQLTNFSDYLDMLNIIEEVVTESGLRGEVQVASFHPHYVFDGEAKDDPANATNRSPYPMFHFIRESYMQEQLANYPNAEEIPENNIRKLRAMEKDH